MLNRNAVIFRKVAQLGSFSKAAQELYISQPAVSRAVKSLESELGIDLFRRSSGNQVELTEHGRMALGLIDQMAMLENELYALSPGKSKGQSGILRVVAFPLATSSIIPAAITLFQRRFPRIVVDVVTGDSDLAMEMVSSGEAQLGIVTLPSQEGLDSVLFTDEIVGISPAGSPASVIDLTKDASGLVLTNMAYHVIRPCLPNRALESFSRTIRLHNASAVVEKIRSDGGIGLIAREVLVGIPNSLVISPVLPKITLYYGMVVGKDVPRYVEDFCQCCHQVVSDTRSNGISSFSYNK